jgi:hypothetical protein
MLIDFFELLASTECSVIVVVLYNATYLMSIHDLEAAIVRS